MSELLSGSFEGKKSDAFLDHELFDLLGGHPLAITLSSNFLKEKRLFEMHQILKGVSIMCDTDLSRPSEMAQLISFEASLFFL